MTLKIILTLISIFVAQTVFAENKMVCQQEALAEGTPIGAVIYEDGSIHGNGNAANSNLKSKDRKDWQYLLEEMNFFLKNEESSQYSKRATVLAYYRCMINAAQRRLNGESYESLLGIKENESSPKDIVKKIAPIDDRPNPQLLDDRPNPQLHKDTFDYEMEKSASFESDNRSITVEKITKCMKVVDIHAMDTQDPSKKRFYYWYSIKNVCAQPINAFWCDNNSDQQHSNDCVTPNKAWKISPGEKEQTWTSTKSPISTVNKFWIHAANACPVKYNGKDVLFDSKISRCWIPTE